MYDKVETQPVCFIPQLHAHNRQNIRKPNSVNRVDTFVRISHEETEGVEDMVGQES